MTDEERIKRRLLSVPQADAMNLLEFIRVLHVRFVDDEVDSVAITCENRPELLLNRGFIDTHCQMDEQLFDLVVHEIVRLIRGYADASLNNPILKEVIESVILKNRYNGWVNVINPNTNHHYSCDGRPFFVVGDVRGRRVSLSCVDEDTRGGMVRLLENAGVIEREGASSRSSSRSKKANDKTAVYVHYDQSIMLSLGWLMPLLKRPYAEHHISLFAFCHDVLPVTWSQLRDWTFPQTFTKESEDWLNDLFHLDDILDHIFSLKRSERPRRILILGELEGRISAVHRWKLKISGIEVYVGLFSESLNLRALNLNDAASEIEHFSMLDEYKWWCLL